MYVLRNSFTHLHVVEPGDNEHGVTCHGPESARCYWPIVREQCLMYRLTTAFMSAQHVTNSKVNPAQHPPTHAEKGYRG